MTTFPALVPSSRTFTPGEYPHTPFAGWSGRQARVRHSNVMLASTLSVSFIGLPAADAQDIVEHFNDVLGTFTPFDLPTELWSGVADATDYTLTGYLWRYAEPPSIEDLPCGGHNVELVLESVPPEGAVIAGLNRRIAFTFAPGVASAANGLNESITLSLQPGTATTFAPGIAESITLSLTAGTVTISGGLLGTVSCSLTPGEAEGGAPVDPDFSSVALLLHMDGSNDSTTFTDSSDNALTMVAKGSAKISTAEKKFGTGSLNCNSGSNAWVEYPGASGDELDVALNQDFTVEFWIYVTAVSTSTFAGGVEIFEFSGSSGTTQAFSMCLYTSGGNRTLAFSQNYGSNNFNHQDVVPLDEWIHVAMVRSSNVTHLYLDGVKSTSSYSNGGALGNSNWVSIGPRQSGASNKLYIDDVRITIGAARFSATFTPPTAAFPDS